MVTNALIASRARAARRGARCSAACWCTAAAVVLAAGCEKATMSKPPSYKPQAPAEFFADGASQRPLVFGVVPRPVDASPGLPYCTGLSPGPAGIGEPAASPKAPFAFTPAVVRRGQERFDIYCAPCHGRTGNGDGIIVQRGFTRPPSFYSKALVDAPDAHFYDVITNGKGAMFSYNERVAPDDRWAITAYVRVLQGTEAPQPAASQPAPSGPAAIGPATSQPAASQPAASGAAASQAATSQPAGGTTR